MGDFATMEMRRGREGEEEGGKTASQGVERGRSMEGKLVEKGDEEGG